ncbi:MAG: hypothetical protein GY714_13220 [Desulfobacterales bacterium]|nr:hypothetical protein [Desulfobacterales bacterium]
MDGKNCGTAYPLSSSDSHQKTVKDPTSDLWMSLTPKTDSVQIDTCGQTHLDITYELYSSCDDLSTEEEVDPVQIPASPIACGSNFYGYIDDHQGAPLFIKIPRVEGANHGDRYTLFIDEIGNND